MNFEVFIEKYLNKVKTREDTGFSSGMAIRDTIKSMYHILRSSDIKRKLFLVEIGPLKLLVFENDQELFNAILYNPVAENIHYSTKNTKSGEDEGMPFEDFIEQHKDDYTYAQQNTLESLLADMNDEKSQKKKQESLDRLNQDDFEILDINHDLEHGRKDLNQGQVINYSDLSEEQLRIDEDNMEEHYQKFFDNFMDSSSLVSTSNVQNSFLITFSTMQIVRRTSNEG